MPAPMSVGPAIVAIVRRPRAMRCSTARPCALAVVDVDVAHLRAPRRPAAHDHGDVALGQPVGQRIVAVEADEQDAVDVAGAEVVARTRSASAGRARHQQDELEVAGIERRR